MCYRQHVYVHTYLTRDTCQRRDRCSIRRDQTYDADFMYDVLKFYTHTNESSRCLYRGLLMECSDLLMESRALLMECRALLMEFRAVLMESITY